MLENLNSNRAKTIMANIIKVLKGDTKTCQSANRRTQLTKTKTAVSVLEMCNHKQDMRNFSNVKQYFTNSL